MPGPGFTSDAAPTLSVGASADSFPIADITSQVGATSSLSMLPATGHILPTSSIEPASAMSSTLASSFTSVSVADMTSSAAVTSTAWQALQPSLVAGVDVSQLPPLQRQLFLRLHQQQKETTVVNPTLSSSHNPMTSQTTAAAIRPHGMSHICCC